MANLVVSHQRGLAGWGALVGLLPSSILAAILMVVLASALAAFNYWAGRPMGTPYAIPTSTGFRVLVAVSGLFVMGSLFARPVGLDWVIVACAAGAVVSYAIASFFHYRSTRR